MTGRQRWIIPSNYDDSDGEGGPYVHNGRLCLCWAIYDGRDARVGTEYVFAPPAQQYGFRLQEWRRRLAEQEAGRLLVATRDNEPF